MKAYRKSQKRAEAAVTEQQAALLKEHEQHVAAVEATNAETLAKHEETVAELKEQRAQFEAAREEQVAQREQHIVALKKDRKQAEEETLRKRRAASVTGFAALRRLLGKAMSPATDAELGKKEEEAKAETIDFGPLPEIPEVPELPPFELPPEPTLLPIPEPPEVMEFVAPKYELRLVDEMEKIQTAEHGEVLVLPGSYVVSLDGVDLHACSPEDKKLKYDRTR